jgi:hypothetical protein
MIQDLKADSANWRIQQSRGGGTPPLPHGSGLVHKPNKLVVRYEDSQTHQSRQYWGPTGSTPGQAPAQPAATPGYGQQDTDPRYYQSTTATARRGDDPYQQAPTHSTGYAPAAVDPSRRPTYQSAAAQSAAAQSPENQYYVTTPSGSNTSYSSGSYDQQYGDQRVPRTTNVEPRRTPGTADYTGTGYQTTTYASPPTQQRYYGYRPRDNYLVW